MPFLPFLLYGLGQAAGGISNAIGSSIAANQLQRGARDARKTIQDYTGRAAGYQQPFYETGVSSLGDLTRNINSGAYDMPEYRYDYGTYQAPNAPGSYQNQQFTGQYTPETFNFQADPGYQFRMQEGQKAIEGSAAARGTQLSGATMKALAKYGQNLASDEYGKAYDRFVDKRNFGYGQSRDARRDYEADRGFGYGQYRDTRGDYVTDRGFGYGAFNDDRNFGYGVYSDAYNQNAGRLDRSYNRLAGLANLGIGAGNNLSNIYSNAGGQIADTQIQQANARAAGTMGTARGIGDIFSGAGQIPLMNYFYGGQ
jgi:hypothetical protein